MKTVFTKKGFTIIEVMVVVAVVVLLGVVGYLFAANLLKGDTKTSQADALNTQAETITEVKSINSASDIDGVIGEIDKLDLDSASSSDTNLLGSEASNL